MDGKDGNSAMHRAAELEIKILKLLIENKADINFANKLQATPLDYAINQSTDVTDLLHRKHGGKTGEELKLKEMKQLLATIVAMPNIDFTFIMLADSPIIPLWITDIMKFVVFSAIFLLPYF